MARDITLPGVWAEDAQTEIPPVPVSGDTYRNPDLSEADAGQLVKFGQKVDSANWNEYMFRLSSLVSEMEQRGILAYSPQTSYKAGGMAFHEGVLYQTPEPVSGVTPPTAPWAKIVLSDIAAAVQSATVGGVAVPKSGTELQFKAYPTALPTPQSYQDGNGFYVRTFNRSFAHQDWVDGKWWIFEFSNVFAGTIEILHGYGSNVLNAHAVVKYSILSGPLDETSTYQQLFKEYGSTRITAQMICPTSGNVRYFAFKDTANTGDWSVRFECSGNITITQSASTTLPVGNVIPVQDNYVEKTIILPNNADLNTIVASGFYRLGNAPVNGPTNLGESGAYSQMIVSRGGDTIAQMIFRHNQNRIYFRVLSVTNETITGAWVELARKEDIPTIPTALPTPQSYRDGNGFYIKTFSRSIESADWSANKYWLFKITSSNFAGTFEIINRHNNALNNFIMAKYGIVGALLDTAPLVQKLYKLYGYIGGSEIKMICPTTGSVRYIAYKGVGSFNYTARFESSDEITITEELTATLPAGTTIIPEDLALPIDGAAGGDLTGSYPNPALAAVTQSNESAAVSPGAGGAFTVIDTVTRDGKGRVTGVKTKAVTLPTAPTSISGNAATATKLATARKIDGISFDGSADITIPRYGTCTTAAATAAKVGTLAGFARFTGAIIVLKFTSANTVANPTLNVNSTGAAAITYQGTAISSAMITTGMLAMFQYDGTNWELLNPANLNTTGNAGTATKLATARTITLAGDATGSVNFDGSANVSITTTINGLIGTINSKIGAVYVDAGTSVPVLPAGGTWKGIIMVSDSTIDANDSFSVSSITYTPMNRHIGAFIMPGGSTLTMNPTGAGGTKEYAVFAIRVA